MNTEIHRVLRICIHFPMWFLPPSSFACLSWEIWSQLSSLPHTLSEQELLVYSMNFIHTINLYLWIIKILYSTALRGGKEKQKSMRVSLKKKSLFISKIKETHTCQTAFKSTNPPLSLIRSTFQYFQNPATVLNQLYCYWNNDSI